MLGDILRDAFRRAHQRLGYIFLDFVWKLIWVAVTTVTLLLSATWVTSGLRGISWDETGIRAVDNLVAAALLREFWRANQIDALLALIFAAAVSAIAWFLLEALFRRRLVGASFVPAATTKFSVLLLSNVAKSLVLIATCLFLVPAVLAGAGTLAVIILAAFAFSMTVVETLIRSDAVEMLGTDLIRVTGLLGILVSFEAMVAVSVVAILGAGVLSVGSGTEAVVMLGVTAAGIVLLTLLHSYLLLVRFSAIAIMRKNVVEV